MPSDKDNHSLRPLGWCKIILSTSPPNLSPLVWFQCPRPRREEHTLALLRRSRGSILSSNTNVPLGLVAMLMVTVDGTEEEEEERENLFECKTTVLNTRGWASVEERGKIKKTEASPSHENRCFNLLLLLSLSVYCWNCFDVTHRVLFLSRCDRWRMIKSRTKWMSMRGRERETEKDKKSSDVVGFHLFLLLIRYENLLPPQKLLPREKQRTVFLSLFLVLSSEYAFALLVVFFSVCLSLSLDLTKVEYSLVIERTSEREIEREERRPDACTRPRKWSAIAVISFHSLFDQFWCLWPSDFSLFLLRLLRRWIIGVRQRD